MLSVFHRDTVRFTVLLAMLSATMPAAADPTDRGAAAGQDGVLAPAANQPQAQRQRLHWRWRRFGAVDYAATALLAGAYLAVEFGTEQSADPRWTGPILFDSVARSRLVASSRSGRDRADRLSDYFDIGPLAVVFAETLIVPVFFDDYNLDVAWHMTVINLQSLALNALLTRGGNRISARERPDVDECHSDPDYSSNCFRGETSSFPSGHTSTAFLGAGLSCAHHLSLALYGNGAVDVAMCSVLSASAATSGTMRIAADRHYLSDVVAGAVIGIGAGFALPMLLHYSGGATTARRPDSNQGLRWTLVPLASPTVTGVALVGWF
jgi:membrane-associated phospholipid phosphatase